MLFSIFFFGQNYRKKKIYGKKGDADVKLRKALCVKQADFLKKHPEVLGEASSEYKKLINQNLRAGYNPVEFNRDISFYFTGRDALDSMFKSIDGAKKYIHIQSYIIEGDKTGDRFKNLLIKKSLEGVEVRVIFDGLGSYSLKKKFLNDLRKAGVEILVFSPVKFLLPTFTLNYRNHRKILIIDGKDGFLGGVNVADRYYYGTENGDWHDTHIKIRGDAVSSLQTSFFLDRYFILNRKLNRKKYFPPKSEQIDIHDAPNSFISQTIVSGPDSYWASIMQCFFSIITSAKDHIYIVTPYFTPSETILNAIKIASLGGIDVKILLPEVSDSKITHWCTMSYVQELLDTGVKIYLFRNGFNHSKVISVDGKMCIIGSANMDMRSFEHNFEIMSLIYNENCSKVIEDKFKSDIEKCRLINSHKWKKRSVEEKIKESFGRLWSPLI